MTRTYISDTPNKIGEKVTIEGFVNSRRDLGNIIFLDIRDETGTLQAVFTKDVHADYKPEEVLSVDGLVKERDERNKKTGTPTGTIELEGEFVRQISPAKTPPFPLNTDGLEIDENLRNEYRYLDLRRERMQKNIRFRHNFVTQIRKFFNEENFVEIETPLLTKSTPEGARDFLVPSRLHKGKFYALPQAPQQYKQLLMISGFERYYQIAKCLRDEDLRADRGFEHTQLDLEMSFVEEQDVRALVERMIATVIKASGGTLKDESFPVFTYAKALEEFGADKFDLRTEQEKEQNIHALAWVTDFPMFEKTEKGLWTFTHNPFSDPKDEHKDKLLSGEVKGILAKQFDLVWNGVEIGSGSIRSTAPKIMKKVFEIIGYSEEEMEKEFGHLIKAYTYGSPVHGGMGLGLDRMVAMMLNENSMREVVAFPQSYTGKTAVMEAPSSIPDEQLKELGLRIEE